MKILLFGANGQVGWELQRSLSPLALVESCDRTKVDLEDFEGIRAIVRDSNPDVIVNAAAYTAVDKAESEVDKSQSINGKAVGVLAEEAKRIGAWLIHYSTDYVYDGSKSDPYVELDPTNPLGVYGKTKLEGEEAIRDSGCKYLIFRTSWVYGARGSNFAKTMLRLAKERDELKVVADQYGAPASSELIADVTAYCISRIMNDEGFANKVAGVYHLTPSGETSWHGFAQYVLAEAKDQGVKLRVAPESVKGITTAEYPLPAERPANSRLNTDKLARTFGVNLPPWQFHVRRLITKLTLGDAS